MAWGSSLTSDAFGPEGSGRSSVYGWEEDGSVSISFLSVHGYVLEITDRLRLSDDKKKLTFSIQIKGPDGTETQHEFEFGLPDKAASTDTPA